MDVFGEVAPALPPSPPESPPSPPPTPPEPIFEEPVFDRVDTAAWDSNWDEGWGESAEVFVSTEPSHVPEAVQDDVDWDSSSQDAQSDGDATESLPTAAALKRMKKSELVELAKSHGVDSAGTKADIIGRLLA
tara:strand:+ start:82 stop:480 length:399 start_codon:yes stop_codon:yes gene_type:complete